METVDWMSSNLDRRNCWRYDGGLNTEMNRTTSTELEHQNQFQRLYLAHQSAIGH